MVELVDTTDLKSVDPKGRAGSSPAPGTKREIAAMRSPVFVCKHARNFYVLHFLHASKPQHSDGLIFWFQMICLVDVIVPE